MDKIHRKLRDYLINEIRYHKENKRQLEEYKLEIIERSKTADGMPRGSGTSDPTASKATELCLSPYIINQERIIRAIDDAMSRATPEQIKIINMLYVKRTHTADGVADALGMHRRTVYKIADHVINDVAKQLGHMA